MHFEVLSVMYKVHKHTTKVKQKSTNVGKIALERQAGQFNSDPVKKNFFMGAINFV